ncbi:unnamed protein product, partial [Darwinula stevensoni]
MEAAFMKAFKQKPIFGVCVGQQMLFETSQEGDATCLGVYRGTVDRFPVSDTLKIPHMGWNQVKQLQNHPMWSGIDNFANFYFVHSYYVHPSDTQIILGSTQYGVDFASCVGKDNVFATQFHPEKTIDIKDGKCVRLVQGDMDQVTIFSEDPIEMALKWVDLGAERLHLVDLDGAVAGKPKNEGLIKELIAEIGEDFPIQLGGGIRNLDTIESYLNDGLSYVIIGTAAIKNPGFLQDACLAFPRQIIVGLDAKDGKVATDGWSKMTGHDVIDLAKKYEDYGVESIIYTDIGRDGMLQGINWEATLRLAQAADIPVIASGGLAGMKDIEVLCEHGDTRIEGVICGRAIYSGDLDFAKALDYRIIPCLDVNAGRVVKGVNFVELKDAGDPVEVAKRYYDQGADEITFLDITATSDDRDLILHMIEAVAKQTFIPLTVGGGIRTNQDVRRLLNAGADKVSINSAALLNPDLVNDVCDYYGSQCIVIAIDAKQVSSQGEPPRWEVFTHGGRKSTGINAVAWAKEVVERGA